MTINVTYSQFLFSNGVSREQANTIGAKIASKIWDREPLTREEATLTAVYLNRPGANAVAERHVDVAILTSNSRNTIDQHKARSSSRVPAHTPEWSNPRPGDPGKAEVRVQGWDYKTKEKVERGKVPTDVRELASRVAANFSSSGSGSPAV